MKTVDCPHCGTKVTWSKKEKYRPFCSERCKMIDLGAWADESYSVGSESPSPMENVSIENLENKH